MATMHPLPGLNGGSPATVRRRRWLLGAALGLALAGSGCTPSGPRSVTLSLDQMQEKLATRFPRRYPVAGLVMQPGVIAAFGAKARYFNTFGGNAVAAAVGLAVLDVIRDEGLQQNAATVGAAFADGLRALATRHDALGETRAAPLFIGQTILRDGQPDPARTAQLVNGLRDQRILISSTGPQGDSLKIRPPLPFSLANVDQVLSTLDRLLPTL